MIAGDDISLLLAIIVEALSGDIVERVVRRRIGVSCEVDPDLLAKECGGVGQFVLLAERMRREVVGPGDVALSRTDRCEQ